MIESHKFNATGNLLLFAISYSFNKCPKAITISSESFFRKICMNSNKTYYKGKFRFPKENAKIIELPRLINLSKEN